MAGIKGKSGGARPGAGRKPKPRQDATALLRSAHPESPMFDGDKRDPLTFLEVVMNDAAAPLKDRVRCAIAAAQYRHTRRSDGGKKEEAVVKAKAASGGRYATRSAPLKLVAAQADSTNKSSF